MDFESFRVLVRLKPSTQGNLLRLHEGHVPYNQISLPEVRGSVFKEQTFAFENVFVGNTSELYLKGVQSQVHRLASGFNATCMAYGATGSGKTHTMFGSLYFSTTRELGIVGLALRDAIQELTDSGTWLTLSYLEIYNERINDLLGSEEATNLGLMEDAIRGVYVPGLVEKPVSAYEEALDFIRLGNARRKQAHTRANAHSTRSHVMLTLSAEQSKGLVSKLHLLDLAGSERAAKGEGRGIRVVEGGNINKSLLTLGNCITVLSDSKRKGAFVPYRDSKLTRLIKDSLGGTALTTFIACISPSPSALEETLQTLKYAERAQCIKISTSDMSSLKDSICETQTEFDKEKLLTERLALVDLQENTEDRVIVTQVKFLKRLGSKNKEDFDYFQRVAESLKDHMTLIDSVLVQLKRKEDDSENVDMRKRLDSQILEAKLKQKLLQVERTGLEKDRIISEMAKEIHAMKLKLRASRTKRAPSLDMCNELTPAKQTVKSNTGSRTCDPSPKRPTIPKLQLSSLSEIRKAHKEGVKTSRPNVDTVQFLSGYNSARSMEEAQLPDSTRHIERSASLQPNKFTSVQTSRKCR